MEWEEITIDICCDLIAGYAFKSKDFGEFDTKVIRIGDITPPFVHHDSAIGVNLANYDHRKIERYKIKYNDFVLAMTGATIGKVGRYISDVPSYVNQRVLLFKSKEGYDHSFIYYTINSYVFSQYVLNHIDSESAQPNISANTISKFSFKIPANISDQRKIAGILSALDAKIENNNKINANLESQAQALFKSWFVDFTPFKDQPFVDSELGPIPQGWKVGKLGDIALQSTEKVLTRNDVKVLSPITTGKLVLSEEYFTKQVFSKSIRNYKIVKQGAFAYNPARVNIGSLGMNEFKFDGCVSPVYVVFECLKGYSFFFDLFRKTEFFKQAVISFAIGGVRQTLNYSDFALIDVTIPPLNIVQSFNEIYLHLKKKISINEKENQRLAALRDTLLPKLMSGEIKL